MSIIYDALKKTETAAKKDQITQGSAPKKRHPAGYFIFILFILAGFVIANFSFAILNKSSKKPLIKTEPANLIQEQPQSAIPPIPIEADILLPSVIKTESQTIEEKKPLPNLMLNGLFYSEHDSWAMINNQIFKKGDYAEGAILLDILPEEVILDFEGEKIILRPK